MSTKQTAGLFLAFERWGFDVKSWRRRTRDSYLYRTRAVDAWLVADRNVSVVFAELQDLRDYLFQTAPVERTRNGFRQALIGFYDFLIYSQIRQDNPAKGLPRYREPESIPKALESKQASKILQAAKLFDPQVEVLVTLFLFTGVRREGARMLQWPQLDLDGGWMRFDKKGAGEVVLPLHPIVVDALRRWKLIAPEPQWVFPSPVNKGQPMSYAWIADRVREVGDLAGVPGCHPHMLRHTFATTLLEESDVRTVQVALGHKHLSSTQLYTKVRPVRLQEKMEKVHYG